MRLRYEFIIEIGNKYRRGGVPTARHVSANAIGIYY